MEGIGELLRSYNESDCDVDINDGQLQAGEEFFKVGPGGTVLPVLVLPVDLCTRDITLISRMWTVRMNRCCTPL